MKQEIAPDGEQRAWSAVLYQAGNSSSDRPHHAVAAALVEAGRRPPETNCRAFRHDTKTHATPLMTSLSNKETQFSRLRTGHWKVYKNVCLSRAHLFRRAYTEGTQCVFAHCLQMPCWAPHHHQSLSRQNISVAQYFQHTFAGDIANSIAFCIYLKA